MNNRFDEVTFRQSAWLLTIWAVCTACNLFKPFHIDDTAYVRIAQWICAHPLHPMQGTLNWTGVDEPIYRILHPHLYMYVLAAWGRVFGFSPVSLHLVQSIVALGCIVVLYRLLFRFVPKSALWGTAIIVLSPAFVVEQNLMIDVPLLFTWLVFFHALLCGISSSAQTRRYVLAGLACSAALLTKYSSIILLPILLFSLVWEGRRKQAWTLALPIATLLAWSAFNYLDYGGFHLLVKSPEGQHHSLVRFGIAWLVTLGGLTPLGILASFRHAKNIRQEMLLWILSFVFLAVFIVSAGILAISGRRSDWLLAFAFAINGVLILVSVIWHSILFWKHDSRPSRSDPQVTVLIYLLLWLGAPTAFYLALAPFIAARHVLLTLPPLTLLLLWFWRSRLSSVGKICSLVLTLAISCGLTLSDFRFARFQSREAASVQASLATSGTWWTNGHLGWMYYAQERGFRPFDRNRSVFQRDDYFVVPSAGLEDVSPELLPYLRLVRTDLEEHPLLSLLCTGRPARLYRSHPTFGAWSISADCTSRFDVYKVIADKRPYPVSHSLQ